MQFTSNVYIEIGWPGANVGYVTTEDGLVMIDTPRLPTDAIKWRKQIESKGNVKYLINTESHDDHFFSDFFFEAPVVAHNKTREAILATDINHVLEVIANDDPDSKPLISDYKVNIPCITFSEQLTLYVGKHSFRLIHLPGHCSGQTAVFVPEEKVVFTGDNVSHKIQGFLHEAEPYNWLESLNRLSELEVDYIVPGHGEACDKSFLKEQAEFVQECIDKMKKAIEQGWTKEECLSKVSFERYPLDAGIGAWGQVLLQMSVSHMYDIMSQ